MQSQDNLTDTLRWHYRKTRHVTLRFAQRPDGHDLAGTLASLSVTCGTFLFFFQIKLKHTHIPATLDAVGQTLHTEGA